MPSTYAHYRFGAQVLPTLPGNIREIVERYRNVYDVGTHGPDLFFYYRPAFQTSVGKLGGKFHHQPGRSFFGGVCRRLRMQPSEQATAYLYGLLSHYSLDSICHPFVNRASSGGSFSHTALESEFDRFLLTKDKVEKPHLRNLGKHLHLSDGECDTLRLFYPPATKGQIRESLRSMAAVTKLLGSSNPLLRGLTVHTLRATGESNAGLVMPEAPDARCAELDEPMLELYEQALGNYPEQAARLQEHLLHQEPLGELFEPEFG